MTTELILHRVLKAPRHLIYQSWTQPEHMAHWFMPKPHFLTDVVVDLRPGGRFASTMHVDGNVIPSEGMVLDAITDTRFAFTDMMSADFQPHATPGLGFTATIELSDAPEGGTVYHVTARHRTAEDATKHEAMGFTVGWGMVADQLEAYAAGLSAAPDDLTMTLTRTFRATPAQVYAAWTDPSVLPGWFGPEGWSCRTKDIDIREGGQWVFDMTAAGMTFANRHRYTRLVPEQAIDFLMDDGSDKSAPHIVEIRITSEGELTRLTQTMTFPNAATKQGAVDFGAEALGYTTLAKLAAVVEG
jgi:uncharacterized protein YndB with AHSA1/START domain